MTTGIPTYCDGYRMRSRLEASWGHFFALCGWHWKYEPVDLSGYIPDFLLTFARRPLLIEVKPEGDLLAMGAHTEKIDESGWDKNALIVGTGPPRPIEGLPVIGLMRQSDPIICGWDAGVLFRCMACRKVGIYHQSGFWECPNCGMADGASIIGPISARKIYELWAEAQNSAQWNTHTAEPELGMEQCRLGT